MKNINNLIQKITPKKGNKKLIRGVFIGAFTAIGVSLILLTSASSNLSTSLEAESGTPAGSAVIVDNNTAAGNKAIKFSATPPPTGGKPTRNNTGPRYPLTSLSASEFLNTRTCNKQKISEDVEIRDSKYKGQTFNINDCEVRRIVIAFGNTTPLPESQLPIINIDNTFFPKEFITGSAAKLTINHSWVDDGASQFKLTDNWLSPTAGPFPLKVMNSVFVDNYITQPAHSEALQTSDDNNATGMEFTNTVFMVRAGPLNNTGVTATVNFHGIDAVFDGCYFLWEGAPPVPAWYSAQFIGTNIVVKNSWFEKGAAGYIATANGSTIISQNNRDVVTGNLLEGSTAP